MNTNSYFLSRYVFIIPEYFKPPKDLWVDLITGRRIAVPHNFRLDENSLAKLPKKLTELLSKYFLCSTPEVDVERGMKFLRSFQYSRKTVHFTINTTNLCNCNCSYCYNIPTRQQYSPNLDSIPNLAEFMINTVNQLGAKHLDVYFSGGEPLLYTKFVTHLSERLLKASIQGNFRYTAELATNGTLLTREIGKSLKDSGIHSIQVTLDGFPHNHNKLRPLKNEQGSYQKIMAGIADGFAELDVHIRCHIYKNYNNWITSLLQTLSTFNLDCRRITMAPAAIDSTPNTPEEAKKLSLSYAERAEVFPSIWEEIEKHGFKPNTLFTTSFLCSGNRRNSFALNADGNLFKCMCSGSFEAWNIGCISKGVLWDKVDYLIEQMLRPECKECRFLPICAGECPLHLNPTNSCPVGLKSFLQVSLEYDFRRKNYLNNSFKCGGYVNANSI